MRDQAFVGTLISIPSYDGFGYVQIHPNGDVIARTAFIHDNLIFEPITQEEPVLTGHTAAGDDVVVVPYTFHRSSSETSYYSDNLFVSWSNVDPSPGIPDPYRITTLWIGLDPKGVASFFELVTGVRQFTDGQVFESYNLDQLNYAGPGSADDFFGRTELYLRRYIDYIDASGHKSIFSNNADYLVVELSFEKTIDWLEATRLVRSFQCILLAAGNASRDGGVKNLQGYSELPTSQSKNATLGVAWDWWSKQLQTTTQGPPSRREAFLGHNWHSYANATLGSVGGPDGILRWMEFGTDSPYIIDAIINCVSDHITDPRMSITSLASAWEHFTQSYARPKAHPAEIMKEIVRKYANWREEPTVDFHSNAHSNESLTPVRETLTDPRIDSIISLAWNTYNQIKHHTLRDETRPVVDTLDRNNVDALVRLMVNVLLLAIFDHLRMTSCARDLMLELRMDLEADGSETQENQHDLQQGPKGLELLKLYRTYCSSDK